MSIESIVDRGRARMADMFEQRDQLAVFYDLTETADGGGGLATDWSEVAQAFVSFARDASIRLTLLAATELPTGTRELQVVAPFPALQAKQGVMVTTGPEAGTSWRVLFVDRSDRLIVRALVQPLGNEDFI